jgi:hypothetical protein
MLANLSEENKIKNKENEMRQEEAKTKTTMIAARVDKETKDKIEEVRRALGERSLNAVMLLGVQKMIKEVLGDKSSSVASA